jgi:uncharacterized protein
MPLYVKIFHSTAAPSAFENVMPDMMAYLAQLKGTGKLKSSGPFGDFSGGLDIYEADNLDEAKKIAEEDPLVSNQLGTYELKEWSDMLDQI